ncbi:MAG TPA: hypothetical protein VIM75_00745 [Ohtaekwangia sp.]|uniref:hypothetical protein n=1 Tax=Ohtaekwangia sp. TaxID=2066019 RepID=UPI002F9243FD
MKYLLPDKIENYSGFRVTHRNVHILKKNQYYVTDQTVSGDAPKKFIRLYEYGSVVKRTPKSGQPTLLRLDTSGTR